MAVTLSDFKIAPAVMQVPAGQPVEFDVSNQGPSAHTFTIVVGGEQKGTSLIQAGSNATLNIPALAAGTYQALCTVSGHAQLGMKATVEATNGASASPSSAMGSMDPMGSAASGAPMTAQQMAAMHAAGVKVFSLFVARTRREVSKGSFVDAMSLNGRSPGRSSTCAKGIASRSTSRTSWTNRSSCTSTG